MGITPAQWVGTADRSVPVPLLGVGVLHSSGTICDAMTSVYEARPLVSLVFRQHAFRIAGLLSTSCPLPCPEVLSLVGVAGYARQMLTQLPALALQGDTSPVTRRSSYL